MIGYSKEIIDYKNSVMTRILESKEITDALDARDSSGNPMPAHALPFAHIFPYGFIPNAKDPEGCYITVEVTAPEVSKTNHFFKDVLLIITVNCHRDMMQMAGEKNGTTRADYIASVIEELFDNMKGMGFREMPLISNTEKSEGMYHSRIMSFRISSASKAYF